MRAAPHSPLSPLTDENRVRFAEHLKDLISTEIIAAWWTYVKVLDTKYPSSVITYMLYMLYLLIQAIFLS